MMSLLSTENAPYTALYLQELLGLEESALKALASSLALQPVQDAYTGEFCFTQDHLLTLRQAVELGRRGESLASIVQQLRPAASVGFSAGELAVQQKMTNAYAQAPQGNVSVTGGTGKREKNEESFAVLVETISASKELILQEMGRLLDDRLSGLDEVVVELIRCKSENDSLRQKLSQAIREKEVLQQEVASFKPVQFGFYKKTR